LIHLQLNAVRVKPPINRMAEAFKPTFGRLYGPFDASGATDHDTLLQAPEVVICHVACPAKAVCGDMLPRASAGEAPVPSQS
jgi:hypothetical protein